MSANRFQKYTQHSLLALLGFLLISLAPNSAQVHTTNAPADAVMTDFLNVYSFTTDKVDQLANAMPVEKMDWRPAEGIRSVKESILHVAAGNYFFGSQLGAAVPEGVDPQNMEKSDMSKEEAIAALNTSIEYVKNALNEMDTEAMETTITLMGNEMTKRQAVFFLGDHAAEHLGQLIAYARMNGVAPPWSQPQGQ